MDNILYNKDGIIVRNSVMNDVLELKDKLRESDIEEIWASHHHKSDEALIKSLEVSVLALTVVYNDEVIAMCGLNPEQFMGNRAVIWFLASMKLDNIQRRFVRQSKKFINIMLNMYPYLYNYTYSRNEKAIEWLRFCGANIEDARPYGIEGKLFHYFYFSRN